MGARWRDRLWCNALRRAAARGSDPGAGGRRYTPPNPPCPAAREWSRVRAGPDRRGRPPPYTCSYLFSIVCAPRWAREVRCRHGSMHRGVRARCALLPAVGALWPLFPRDPSADRGWAMEKGHAFGLTTAEEAHHLDIYQRHLPKVQHDPGAVAFQLCLQCLQMLRLHVANQPECGVV